MKLNICRKRQAETAFDSERLLLDIKREIKTEINQQVAPLRDAVILLNTLLPVCDLTTGESEIEISDTENENQEQAAPLDASSKNIDNIAIDDLSGSIPFETDPVIPHLNGKFYLKSNYNSILIS